VEQTTMQAETSDGAPAVTTLELELWRLVREEAEAPGAPRDAFERWVARRAAMRPVVAAAVERFVGGDTLDAFRAALDGEAREAAAAFGFDGLSGARFLNKLVAVTTERDGLEAELRLAVAPPNDAAAARARLQRFVGVLRALARARRLSARDLQPARAAFLVSACWHAQRPEAWPAFHLVVRQALVRQGGLRAPSGDPATDYLAFRHRYAAMEGALGAGAWELEYLCRWQHTRRGDDADEPHLYPSPRPRRAAHPDAEHRLPTVREPAPSMRPTDARDDAALAAAANADAGDGAPGPDHTHAQWLLATLGRALGCRVWVAPNDRAREWNGQPLGALSVKHFPTLAADPASRRLIQLIDVVWLHGTHRVAAAFEVEHTTSVYSGLLRLADLATVCPNLNVPLYVVAPEARLDKVRRELARPAFQALGLHRRCGFFSSEALADAAAGMMRWATSPAALERLAERVGDVPAEELAG
jgi:hypothetical protein